MSFDEFILCAEILHNKHVIIKSEGKYMNREIEQVILAQGYRFCTVQPENVGVFYKYYQQGFHVVMMISLDDIIRREGLQISRKVIRFIMWNCLHCWLEEIRI